MLTTSKKFGGLGLRDLRAFNSAMLAKQFWRLLIYPESLLGQLLNARYYPDSSILETELGSRPSITWRSVLSSKSIILAGHRWRIGDGHTIKIWIDPWIPSNSSYRPSLHLDPLPPQTTVDHLLPLKEMITAITHSSCVPLAIWFGASPIFNGIPHKPDQVVSFARGYLDSFTEITVPIPSFNTTTVFALWRPPENGFVKINYDVALFLDTGDFEIAEAWVARATIDLGIRFKRDKIIIEGDCANLVKQLVDREGYSSSTEVLIHDIFALCPQFLSCSFSLVHRQGNCVAHSLALSAVNFAEGLTDLPNLCIDAILADLPN
ncbi:UNVERIFIED_CONTAM: putative mitochondrial protein [Sesamum radiatum]|uniref:Mitochondrial protein n=1 Tax=Sesamum radiatum TaxID=300843 RepID=A0AAW2S756_SESRA